MATGIGALIGGGVGAIMGSQRKKERKEEARAVEERAGLEARQIEKDVERLKSRQKAMFIASGVDLTGSPLDLIQDTLTRGAEQASRVREMGSRTARGLKSRGKRELISSIFQGLGSGATTGARF